MRIIASEYIPAWPGFVLTACPERIFLNEPPGFEYVVVQLLQAVVDLQDMGMPNGVTDCSDRPMCSLLTRCGSDSSRSADRRRGDCVDCRDRSDEVMWCRAVELRPPDVPEHPQWSTAWESGVPSSVSNEYTTSQ
jgi:hypothetical protein